MAEDREILKDLETLCGHPTLHITQHFREVDGELIYVISASDALPAIDEKRKAFWAQKDLAIDIFYDPSLAVDTLHSSFLARMTHWTRLICTILTFKGHEVFLDGELFKPYE